jgi:hypothetical protein
MRHWRTEEVWVRNDMDNGSSREGDVEGNKEKTKCRVEEEREERHG